MCHEGWIAVLAVLLFRSDPVLAAGRSLVVCPVTLADFVDDVDENSASDADHVDTLFVIDATGLMDVGPLVSVGSPGISHAGPYGRSCWDAASC